AVPATAVYLVSSARMASMPAFFTWVGVSKSSSPSPRLITVRPAALNSRSRSEISAVGDGLMRATRGAMWWFGTTVMVLFPERPSAAVRRQHRQHQIAVNAAGLHELVLRHELVR